MELTMQEPLTSNRLKGKSLDEVVNNGWNRLSELYGVDMRQLAVQHNFKYK
ncbi:MAG: hypothetical protein LBN27_07905 [Prevotellaceae bacterium]|jgi:hypothetical protein|nr:hypothetical protein [Prevotellaceae bacterium]